MVYNGRMVRVQVRELRQNASQVVRNVEEHGPVVVTVNGRDAVLMTPLRARQRWIPASEARRYWEESQPDPAWAEEVDRRRDADQVVDPWQEP